MSIITFDRVPASSVKAPIAPTAVTGRGFWARLLDRLVEARQRRAMEEIRRYHRFVLPRELEGTDWKTSERSENSLPFVR